MRGGGGEVVAAGFHGPIVLGILRRFADRRLDRTTAADGFQGPIVFCYPSPPLLYLSERGGLGGDGFRKWGMAFMV